MLQNSQTRAQLQVILSSAPTGIIPWMRLFGTLQLAFVVVSLILSTLLLFLGSYLQYHSNDLQLSALTVKLTSNLFGINVGDFSEHLPLTEQDALGSTLLFVGSVSIFVEVALICAIIFEHFKFCVILSSLLLLSLVNAVASRGVALYAASLTFQLIFLITFCLFTAGIQVKIHAANRLLTDELELNDTKGKKSTAM